MLVSAPEDYGLSPAETLAHEIRGEPPSGFGPFWATVREEVAALPTRWHGAVHDDDETAELAVPSSRSVRVMARLTRPCPSPRGVVITVATPGSDGFPGTPEPWSTHGLATVRLALRGAAPSTMDLDVHHRIEPGQHWIAHHLGAPGAWILRGAVIDAIQACRCTARHFGRDVPIAVHGEGLGAGIAVIACAQLAQLDDVSPSRLVIALPGCGDWRWREGRYCNGVGATINEFLVSGREERADRLDGLLLFDAAFHARSLRCATLCKLACRDDVEPAPSAAAVFNALGSRRKWRLVTEYGHFEGGLADLQRHAEFDRLHPRFADPDLEPEEAVAGHGVQSGP